MIPLVPFHFVRHGETDWNKTGRMQGRRDIALNATGEAQAEKLRPHIGGHGFRTIAASPLSRARRTAEILNRDQKLPLHLFDELQEFDVGPYEGTEARDWFLEWRLGRPVAGVESFADFTTRVRSAMQQVLALPGPVLVVAHGGVVWALEHLMGLPVETDLPNTILAHFRPTPDTAPRWRIDVLETQA
ncbi:histidine phosphatase family protein [Dongia mobilis]|jgi:broad specificity phosphatase PhoE|uniref:histidine phosphatase family protein n=1 Tax=Dongia sp. TaxID=1977262 RepID=UPI0026F1A36A